MNETTLQAILATVRNKVGESGIYLVADFRTLDQAERLAKLVRELGGDATVAKRGKVKLAAGRSTLPVRVTFTVGIEADQYLAGRIDLPTMRAMAASSPLPKKPKPSKTQIKAAELAASGGLVRYAGGFWSTPGHALPFWQPNSGTSAPPHVTLQTVRAMESRGWLVNVEPDAPEWRARRELTAAGRELLPGDAVLPSRGPTFAPGITYGEIPIHSNDDTTNE